jgi:glycerol kinase
MLFQPDGTVAGSAQQPITQHIPRPAMSSMMPPRSGQDVGCRSADGEHAGGPGAIAAINRTRGASPLAAWDKASGEPLGTALCGRIGAADRRAELVAPAAKPIQAKTGPLLDPYSAHRRWRLLINVLTSSRRRAASLRHDRQLAGVKLTGTVRD